MLARDKISMGIRLSVIVRTFNRAQKLLRVLKCIAHQDFPAERFEVIIVDDGSTDGTVDLVRDATMHIKHMKYLKQSHAGPAKAGNVGTNAAAGELVVFLDDDCQPPSDWLARICNYFDQHPEIDGIGSWIDTKINGSLLSRYHKYIGFLQGPQYYENQLIGLATASAAFRRSALVQTRGFCEQFVWPGGEDTDLIYRLKQEGYKIKFVPDIKCLHEPPETIRGFLRKRYFYGYGASYFCLLRKVPGQSCGIPESGVLHLLLSELKAVCGGIVLAFGKTHNRSFCPSLSQRIAFFMFEFIGGIAYRGGARAAKRRFQDELCRSASP